ncbi:hypothetical protein K4K50_010205 [Colletotrichum sp. SAR 10_71]|nr:hypothetical protein K4K50_010205 [Colletotrichum sp. SAR 10_71]
MTKDYFIDNNKFDGILDDGEYDYVVVGSGCTALAFIQEALRINPHARILCLERGEFWLPAHFQNLPLQFKTVLGGPSETFPWTLSKKTFSDPLLKYCHRSLFWSAWSPQPKVEDMRDFPKEMIDSTKKPEFWDRARDLLHVTGADKIGDSVHSGLQREIDQRLKDRLQEAFPAATILLNSFSECRETVGKRVSGHFLTHIVARAPLSAFKWHPVGSKPEDRRLEIAAHYLAGKDSTSRQQYHVQITAIQSPHPKEDAEDAARECPDYAAAATYEQLEHSTEHVVFVCATLGEFSELNQENWFKMDPSNPDVTTNMKLQYTLTKSDRQLWDTMDQATYETIEQMATPAESESPSQGLEYWHIDEHEPNKGSWKPAHPKQSEIRIPGIVHETSTAFMGSNPSDGSSVGPYYNVHGVPNVYVTGGALFPTAGSWNPTLTMCGFAQDLARQLEKGRH